RGAPPHHEGASASALGGIGASMQPPMRCCASCRAIFRSDFLRCPSDGAELLTVAEDPIVGSTIDHYVVEECVGEGAMGRVYRARHSRLAHRHFALKILLGDLA